MKTIVSNTVLTLLVVFVFAACASRQTTAESEAAATEIRNAVQQTEFRFVPRTAHPFRFRSVQLTPAFSVRVSPEEVWSDMPFFGRAFRAPVNPTEGPYSFTSRDFTYTIVQGRRAGNWRVQIVFNDLGRRVIYDFDIWENGSSRLTITDPERSSISFQGNIERGG